MNADLWPEPVAVTTVDVDVDRGPDAADATPAPTVSRLDRVQEVLRLEGLAAAASARAAAVRAGLAEEARAEFVREGTAPSWRMADVGVVALPISKEAVFVADADALVKWCKERHPHQIRTREEIWPGFQTQLLADCVPAGDGAVDPKTGEVVPGLAVRKGGQPKTLTITAEGGVKRAYVEHGSRWLDDILGGAR